MSTLLRLSTPRLEKAVARAVKRSHWSSDEQRFSVRDLREARSRACNPAQRGFCFVLLGWAANARRRAVQAMRQQPIQGDLFGGAA